MSDVKITDLVDQSAIDKIKELNTEIQALGSTYATVARELARGLDINVKVVGDIDKLNDLLVIKSREAIDVQGRLNQAMQEQGKVIANTTNTISRALMEQERRNKLVREEYTDGQKVKLLTESMSRTYDQQVVTLARFELQMKQNKAAQKELEKAYQDGSISQEEYIQEQAKLLAESRELAVSKSNLSNLMKIEEKLSVDTAGSYNSLSHQLELLKKQYKEFDEEERNSAGGKEFEQAIQDLDAHLKDMAADMGEFQRNVGNYAIAGQNGVVSTESLLAVLSQEAVTMKDVADQTKILEEAKTMLNTSDEGYEQTLATLNAKLTQNRAKLADVSDIMGKQAKSVAEAEAQNKRLVEAVKQVDLTSEDATEKIEAINAKIAENNAVIEENTVSQSTLKKDLKELVLEIATLTVQYNKLSEDEKNSAEGTELKEHIEELVEKAGELKDAIGDANLAISNAASDTRGFDQLAGGLQLAVDGFGLATGAAAMLGIQSEDLAKVQTTLQGAIAASNAMQSIQNALQSQSAVMQGVSLVQKKAAIVAENLHTAAKGKGVIATGLLTAAQWAFNAAAYANPIGLIVLAIIACIAAVYGLIKAFQAFFGSEAEKRKKTYEEEKQALEDLEKANEKEIESAKARGASAWETANMSIDAKKAEMEQAEKTFQAAAAAYDDDEDEYKDALEAKEKASEEYFQSLEDGYNSVQSFLKKYYDEVREEEIGKVAFAKEKAEEDYKNQVELVKKKMQADKLAAKTKMYLIQLTSGAESAEYAQAKSLYDSLVAEEQQVLADLAAARDHAIAKAEKEQAKKDADAAKKGADNAKKAADALRKEVEKGQDALIAVIQNATERQLAAEKMRYDRRKTELLKKIAETGQGNVQMQTALNNQLEALEIEHSQKMEKIRIEGLEKSNKTQQTLLDSSLEATEKFGDRYWEIRAKQLDNQKAQELIKIAKMEAEKTITTEEAEQLRIDLAEIYANKTIELQEEKAEKECEVIQKKYAKEQTDRDNKLAGDLVALKVAMNKELAEVGNNEEKRAAIIEKYENIASDVQFQYAKETSEASIKCLEDTLKNENLSADEREKAEAALAKAKMDLADLVEEHLKEVNQRTVNNERKAADARIAAFEKWFGVASELMQGANDLSQAIFENQLARLDEQTEANTAAGEAEQERISDLVTKKAITEEEGEARKRAAAAKTQKREEELEKKKAAIKKRAAIFDKAIAVANVGMETALALMKLWVDPGWPTCIPMSAVVGALGAMQLATILATPIPQYAKGTDRHPGGPAIVGDGGQSEVVMYGGKSFITPDTPTLVDLPTGAVVLPSVQAFDPEKQLTPIGQSGNTSVVVNNDYKDLQREMAGVASLIKRQTRQQHTDAYLSSYELYKRLRI